MAAACSHTNVQTGWTALLWAGWNGHEDCARLLLDAGADKEAKASVRGRSRSASSIVCVCACYRGYARVLGSHDGDRQ